MNTKDTSTKTQKNDLVSLSERETLLRAIPSFMQLNMAEIAFLAGLMEEVYIEATMPIVVEGELVDSVYILVSGVAEVTKEVIVNGKSGTTLLATLNKGENIGLKDSNLFSETGTRTATVTATSTCLLLKLPLTALNKFLKDNPKLLENISSNVQLMLRMQLIKEIAPFSPFTNQRILWLANQVKELNVEENVIIYKQDDPVDNCYLLYEGKVEIVEGSPDGSEKKVIVEPTNLFGESAFSTTAKRNNTARTLTSCKLLLLDSDLLLELISKETETPDTLVSLLIEHCRPIRVENIIHQHRTTVDNQVITTLKNPINNAYFQLTEEGWFIWKLLDGHLTLQEINNLFYQKFGHANQDEVVKIIQSLVGAGFAHSDMMKATLDSTSNKASDKGKGISSLFNRTYLFLKADRKIDFLYRRGGFLFTTIPAFLILLAVVIAGLVTFHMTITKSLATFQTISHIPLWFLAVIFFSMTLMIINPLTKGLMIKRFSHEIPHFGIIWRGIAPVGFIDTSDMWLSARKSRIAVIFSGIFANFVMASLLSLYAYYTDDPTLSLFAWISALFIYLQTLRSLDPLLDLDGYALLSEILDSYQLRNLSIKWLLDIPENLPDKTESGKFSVQENIFWLYCLSYLTLIVVLTAYLEASLLPIGFYPFYWIIFALPIAFYLLELVLEIRYQRNLLYLARA